MINKLLTKEEIKQGVDSHFKKLAEQFNELMKVEDNPELILTELFDPNDHQSHYNELLSSVNRSEISVHDIQRYLHNILEKYFKSLRGEDGADIKLSMPTSYPSSFKIMYKDFMLINFNFYNHTFSVNSINESIVHSRREIDVFNKDIENMEKDTTKYVGYRDNVWSILKDPVYKKASLLFKIKEILLLIRHKQKFKLNLGKKIELLNAEIKRIEDMKERYEQRLQSIEQKYQSVIREEVFWCKKFNQWGYKNNKRV